VWKASLPASILGTYVSLWMWMAGFKYTYASVAALLNQTSVVFALIFAALILKESLGRRKLVAITLALGGAVVVWWAQNRPAA
jgi:drug/metabolite transporter (DMT)-like permease